MRDSDVRAAVRSKLDADYAGDDTTRIVEEMGVWSGSVRIDIAVINGELSGFELKSDRDTLDRLPFQAELYSRVFDRLVLVVGERHAAKALAHIPDWWGVMIATPGQGVVSLALSRKSQKNPSLDPYLIAQLLWKDEAIFVLESFGLAKGWRSRRVRDIHCRLATELPIDVLSERVRGTLCQREGWLGKQ